MIRANTSHRFRQRIREIALQHDGEELRDRMQAAGVPCALLSSLEEAMLSEHAQANDYVHSFDHPAVGPVHDAAGTGQIQPRPLSRRQSGRPLLASTCAM